MMENNRDVVDDMLTLLRKGDWAGYQAMVTGWGTCFDKEFEDWLEQLCNS